MDNFDLISNSSAVTSAKHVINQLHAKFCALVRQIHVRHTASFRRVVMQIWVTLDIHVHCESGVECLGCVFSAEADGGRGDGVGDQAESQGVDAAWRCAAAKGRESRFQLFERLSRSGHVHVGVEI